MISRFFPGAGATFEGLIPRNQTRPEVQLFNPLLAMAGLGGGSVVSGNMSCYLPEGYENKYPYPLVVWFHDDGADERQLHSLFPQLSGRNYVGLSFRGSTAQGDGYCWQDDSETVEQFAEILYPSLCAMRKTYHIHSERIYLAGMGAGAGMALQLLLYRPEWFRGAITFSESVPAIRQLNPRHPLFQNKRLLMNGVPSSGHTPSREAFASTTELLRTMGLESSTRLYESPAEKPSLLTAEMSQDLNYWLMSDISSASLV